MIPKTFLCTQTEKSSRSPEIGRFTDRQPGLPLPRGSTPAPGRDHRSMPPSLTVAVNPTGPQTGLQSRWYRQHRSPGAPDRPEPGETPGSPCSNAVKAQVHLVQRLADRSEASNHIKAPRHAPNSPYLGTLA